MLPRSLIRRMSAMSPSMEKTPSVMIMMLRAGTGSLARPGPSQTSMPSRAFVQGLLERGHVGVVVDEALGLAQADAVDDRGVVEGVGDDGVLGPEQGFEQAAVGVEAGGVEDGVLHLEEFGDFLLELLVEVLRAADEADRGQAEAVLVEGLAGGLEDLRDGWPGRGSCWRRNSGRRAARFRPGITTRMLGFWSDRIVRSSL